MKKKRLFFKDQIIIQVPKVFILFFDGHDNKTLYVVFVFKIIIVIITKLNNRQVRNYKTMTLLLIFISIPLLGRI